MLKKPTVEEQRTIFLTLFAGTMLSCIAQSADDPHDCIEAIHKRMEAMLVEQLSEDAHPVCLNDLQVAIDRAKYELALPRNKRTVNVERSVKDNVVSVPFGKPNLRS